jgi:hypothetical protein
MLCESPMLIYPHHSYQYVWNRNDYVSYNRKLYKMNEKYRIVESKHKPFKRSDMRVVPCGKCLLCLEKKAKEWAHRIKLEADYYKVNAYVTLTYNDDNLPDDEMVSKEEIQKYLKRVRYYLKRDIKYYVVAEYGPKNLRPHYHLIIFGADGNDYHGQVDRLKLKEPILETKDDWYYLHKAWQGKGFTKIESPKGGAYHYVAGYVTKMAKNADLIEEAGLFPEFRMASKGLGKRTVMLRALAMKKKVNFENVQMPIRYFTYGKKYKKPLGRFLTNVFHQVLGLEKVLKTANFMYRLNCIHKYKKLGMSCIPQAMLEDLELKSQREKKLHLIKMKLKEA